MEDQVNASHRRFPRTLLASAFALAAFAPAPALGHGPQTCDTHARATSGIASDPEEGGQVTAAKDDGSVGATGGRTGYDLKANAKARTGGGSSDPEEGGEVTSAAKAAKGKGNVHIGDMQVTKHHDVPSTNLFRESGSASNCH
jgi:hypothetical protein